MPRLLRRAHPVHHARPRNPPLRRAGAVDADGWAFRLSSTPAQLNPLANRGGPTDTLVPMTASARFFTTDRVRVEGATWKDTGVPPARATVARQRWIRLARA